MNRIKELFGIKYPIIQGGMIWCSGWELASAVSNAGGLGLIGSGSMYPDVLREHIIKCKKATHMPFGVNLPLLYANSEEHIKVIIEEEVKIEEEVVIEEVIEQEGVKEEVEEGAEEKTKEGRAEKGSWREEEKRGRSEKEAEDCSNQGSSAYQTVCRWLQWFRHQGIRWDLETWQRSVQFIMWFYHW